MQITVFYTPALYDGSTMGKHESFPSGDESAEGIPRSTISALRALFGVWQGQQNVLKRTKILDTAHELATVHGGIVDSRFTHVYLDTQPEKMPTGDPELPQGLIAFNGLMVTVLSPLSVSPKGTLVTSRRQVAVPIGMYFEATADAGRSPRLAGFSAPHTSMLPFAIEAGAVVHSLATEVYAFDRLMGGSPLLTNTLQLPSKHMSTVYNFGNTARPERPAA